MLILLVCLSLPLTPNRARAAEKEPVINRMESARVRIGEVEKQQRETLSHLFTINQRIKDISKRKTRVNARMWNQEARVRSLAQEVLTLEEKSAKQKEALNVHLRQLYHGHRQGAVRWLFTAQSPVELERERRFLKLIVDADHRQLEAHLADLRHLKRKRAELRTMVARLARMQRDVRTEEAVLRNRLKEKSELITRLKHNKDSHLSALKGLRSEYSELAAVLTYAFFEKQGSLRAPVDGPVVRDYGTYVDPRYRFHLMHKGLFYSTSGPVDVRAVFNGEVMLAAELPGLGKTVILNHGDNYHSVYARASRLRVKEGDHVREGDLIALSGGVSPLFGPGLYFEIRHFTDAVDPRAWIKEPLLKTANSF